MIAKSGVDLSTLRPEIRRLEPIIDRAYLEFWKPAIVTSANDGTHRANSLHYADLAIDLRVKSVGGAKTQAVFHARLDALIDAEWPGLYDVLLEGAGTENSHIHIEASPALMAQIKAESAHA